jgi:hypothetical protein
MVLKKHVTFLKREGNKNSNLKYFFTHNFSTYFCHMFLVVQWKVNIVKIFMQFHKFSFMHVFVETTLFTAHYVVHLGSVKHCLWRPFSHLIYTILDLHLLFGPRFVPVLQTQKSFSFLAGSCLRWYEIVSSFLVPDIPAVLFSYSHSSTNV